MSNYATSLPALPQSRRSTRRWICAGAALVLTLNILAQSVVVSPPALPLAPSSVRQTAPTDSPFAPNYNEAVSGTGITFGEFRIHPFFSTSYMQSNGLPSGAGSNIDTSIFTFSPGITADIGTHWIMNYTPSWVNYSAASMHDSVNQDFKLIGATKIDAWSLNFSEAFATSRDVLAETGVQTKQHTWDTSLSASRAIGNRSSYEGSAGLNERYADQAPDALTWSTQHWLKSQVSPKVNAGLGLEYSYVDFTNAKRANMKSFQYLGQLSWRPTNKLNLSAQGGLESRRSEAAGTSTMHSPTLAISLGYQPFDHTTLTISDSRSVSNSYFDDTVTKNKGWNVSLNQRLLEKLQLNLTYGEQTSDYTNFGGSTSPSNNVVGRSDDLKSFGANLSVQLFQRWSLAAIYHRSKNTSETAIAPSANFNFSNTQYGLELSARF